MGASYFFTVIEGGARIFGRTVIEGGPHILLRSSEGGWFFVSFRFALNFPVSKLMSKMLNSDVNIPKDFATYVNFPVVSSKIRYLPTSFLS